MLIKILKAKWHWFLPIAIFCILSTTVLIQECINNAPTISIISSTCCSLAGIIVFITCIKQDLDQETNEIVEETIKKIINY